MSIQRRFVLVFLWAIISVLAAATAWAASWSFGVISDTQWHQVTHDNKSVAVNVVDAVNRRFVAAKVDMVLQVGDLTNNGADAALDTRAAHNRALAAAGIPFYPLRGNHEPSLAAAIHFGRAFPNLPGTPDNGGSSPSLPGAAGHSYAFVHNDVKFILLDQFTLDDGSPAGKAYTVTDYQPWIDRELAAKDHRHAFVLAHKDLIGKRHKDNLFGVGDENPAMQDAFFASLCRNGVRYYLCGHDHMHYRSLITSPDGRSTVQQIIGASDSSKFYTPKKPFSPRDLSLARELKRIGYYVYTVDGPRVSARYYSAAPFGEKPADPKWEWRETFGYSLNGRGFLVRSGQSYACVTDSVGAGDGCVGGSMRILAGENRAPGTSEDGNRWAKFVTTGWSPADDATLLGDVLTLWGMALRMGTDETDRFVLSMSIPRKNLAADLLKSGRAGIMSRDADGRWRLAVNGNHGGQKTFVAGPWREGYELGTYGVDPEDRTAWAVVNYASDFAVGAVGDGK